jgi:thiamine pyrophosphate-dependent acetolactate synthase large subunit-like protein
MLHSVNTKLMNMNMNRVMARTQRMNMNILDRHIPLTSKYIKKMNVGQYIVSSLIDKDIKIAFGYNKLRQYSPIFNIINKDENFNIVFDEDEKISAKTALSYVMNNSKIGVIISTSRYGFCNISETLKFATKHRYPMLLLSFFDYGSELKINQFPGGATKMFVKESTTIKTVNQFPRIFEEALSYSNTFPAGPIHLNLANHILHENIDFDFEEPEYKRAEFKGRNVKGVIVKNSSTKKNYIENQPILQYLEKCHEMKKIPLHHSSFKTDI